MRGREGSFALVMDPDKGAGTRDRVDRGGNILQGSVPGIILLNNLNKEKMHTMTSSLQIQVNCSGY